MYTYTYRIVHVPLSISLPITLEIRAPKGLNETGSSPTLVTLTLRIPLSRSLGADQCSHEEAHPCIVSTQGGCGLYARLGLTTRLNPTVTVNGPLTLSLSISLSISMSLSNKVPLPLTLTSCSGRQYGARAAQVAGRWNGEGYLDRDIQCSTKASI